MIKSILVAATGGETDRAAFAAALGVARQFGAHLDMLHVRMDPAGLAFAMTADGGAGALNAGLIERLEAEGREREAKAHEFFARFCVDGGLPVASEPSAGAPSAEWHVEIGEEPRWMAAYGLAADLVVASRATDEEAAARSTLEAVLLQTGRPLLIPTGAALPANLDRVAIAWKPTPQAARAVALAMPWLSRAGEIVVLSVEEQPEQRDHADRLLRNLAWHGLKATLAPLKSGPEGGPATLLAAAAERAQLLVMGGYGHSRLREWVFGGFTQRVLVDAPLPVLLAH